MSLFQFANDPCLATDSKVRVTLLFLSLTILLLFCRMALATRLKNAAKKGAAMQELVQQVTALVAHVRTKITRFFCCK